MGIIECRRRVHEAHALLFFMTTHLGDCPIFSVADPCSSSYLFGSVLLPCSSILPAGGEGEGGLGAAEIEMMREMGLPVEFGTSKVRHEEYFGVVHAALSRLVMDRADSE